MRHELSGILDRLMARLSYVVGVRDFGQQGLRVADRNRDGNRGCDYRQQCLQWH